MKLLKFQQCLFQTLFSPKKDSKFGEGAGESLLTLLPLDAGTPNKTTIHVFCSRSKSRWRGEFGFANSCRALDEIPMTPLKAKACWPIGSRKGFSMNLQQSIPQNCRVHLHGLDLRKVARGFADARNKKYMSTSPGVRSTSGILNLIPTAGFRGIRPTSRFGANKTCTCVCVRACVCIVNPKIIVRRAPRNAANLRIFAGLITSTQAAGELFRSEFGINC